MLGQVSELFLVFPYLFDLYTLHHGLLYFLAS